MDLNLIIGSGIAIIFTDYFKIFGEEGKKDLALVRKTIKYSAISFSFIIFYILMDLYFNQTQLFMGFTEEETQRYTIIYFIYVAYLLILDWLSGFIEKFSKIYFNTINYHYFRYCIRIVICAFVFVLINFAISSKPYNVLKEDAIVRDEFTGVYFIVKKNTKFEFNDSKKEMQEDSINSNISFQSDNSKYTLSKGTRIKLLKNTKLYPIEPIELKNVYKGEKKIEAKLLTNGESTAVLNNNNDFYIGDDVTIALEEKNITKLYIEQSLLFLNFCYLFYCIFRLGLANLFSRKDTLLVKLQNSQSRLLSEIAVISQVKNMNMNSNDIKSQIEKDSKNAALLNSKQSLLENNEWDILLDISNFRVLFYSDITEKDIEKMKNYVLLKIKNNTVSRKYLCFIIIHFLNEASENNITQELIVEQLSKLKIKLISDNIEKLICNDFDTYLESKNKIESYYNCLGL